MSLRRIVFAAAFAAAPALATTGALAGCDDFRWPIERERAQLAAATRLPVANGGALGYDKALTLDLAPFAEAGLPHPPERAPKTTPSFAGHFTLPAPTRPGLYVVTLAADGWLDVIDNGAFLHPKGFTGAFDCEGARKSMKFLLPSHPVNVQLSNVRDAKIALIVTPAD